MRFVLAVVLVTGSAFGQDFYRKHNVTLNAGAGMPRGELRNQFSTSGGIGGLYGYRFHPYFQVEAGYETLFGAARVRDWVPTEFGPLRIRDYQQFLPFGGRVIVPLLNDRIQFHAGGGGAYFRYSERIRQPFDEYGYRIDCIECAVRDGIGYYGLAGVSIAVDRRQNVRIGFGGKVYRGNTSGEPFGPLPGRETVDRWINLFGSVGLSF
jgi:hypothetical protein